MEIDPDYVRQNFREIIVLGTLTLLAIAWAFFRPRSPESHFRDRKPDSSRPPTKTQGVDLLADARMPSGKQKQEPLQLSGIVTDGLPHEVLGMPKNSSEEQIQAAFRELMKRYHPDRIGRPGTREWTDAQRIAEAINRAREAMLASLKH